MRCVLHQAVFKPRKSLETSGLRIWVEGDVIF